MPEPTDEPGSRTAVASYVASMSADLAAMARRTGLDTLGYLLEMVRLEAESSCARQPRAERPGVAEHHFDGVTPSFSSSAVVGLPSGSMPNFFCSARILSRKSKSTWPSNSFTL